MRPIKIISEINYDHYNFRSSQKCNDFFCYFTDNDKITLCTYYNIKLKIRLKFILW